MSIVSATINQLSRPAHTHTTLKLSCSFSFFQRSRLVDVNTCPFSLNLSNWASEPFPSPQKPTPKSPYSHNSNGDWGVIEGLGIDRIGGW